VSSDDRAISARGATAQPKIETAATHQVDQRRRLALEALLAPVDHHAADRCIGLHRDLGILELAGAHDLEAGPLDFRDVNCTLF